MTEPAEIASRADLVAQYKRLARALNEFLPEAEYNRIKRARDRVQLEINRIDSGPTDIRVETTRLVLKGVDLRTIWFHLEAKLGHPLTAEEASQMTDEWRHTKEQRKEIVNRRAQRDADEARARGLW